MTQQQKRSTAPGGADRLPTREEQALDLERLTDEEGLFSVVKRLFTAAPAQSIGELFQNAQRAGACHVRLTFLPVGEDEAADRAASGQPTSGRPQPRYRAFTYADDGHGLQPGLAGMLTLLRLAASAYDDPKVSADQHPMGVGFAALLALDGLERITVRSHDRALSLEPARWWDDAAYRKAWPRLVTSLAADAQVDGLALEVTGDPAVVSSFAEALERTPRGVYQWDDFATHGNPAEGYADILDISINGEPVDTRVRSEWALPAAPIQADYQGNALRVCPTTWSVGGLVAIRWYGQLIFHRFHDRPYQAYLDVQAGRPLTPRAPAREGLVADRALSAFKAHLDDLVFAYVADPTRPLEAVQPREIDALLHIDPLRAARECPYVAIQAAEPLAHIVAGAEEVDQPGAERVIRRDAAPDYFLLERQVRVLWPDGRRDWRFGLASLLTALGLNGYTVSRGAELVERHVFWWRPGPAVDQWHTTTPGAWGIGTAATEPVEWRPLPERSVAGSPLVVFAVSECDGWAITNTDLFLGVAPDANLVSVLERYGKAAYAPRDDEDWETQEQAYAASLDELIRGDYLPGPALPVRFSYYDLQQLFPHPYETRIEQVTYCYANEGEPGVLGQRPTAVWVRAADGAVVEACLYGDPT